MDNDNSADRKFKKEVNSGTAALVLLSILNNAKESMYGYQVAKLIEEGQQVPPMIKQGALYPVLRSLERSGLLKSKVEPSISGPPRRYYSITNPGRETLSRWKDIWDHTKSFVDFILEGDSDD
jgi:PadR family transcriptional regulator PadR